MNKSAYWLSHTPTEKFNLIELAHTQRAISNFVKILTKEEIKSFVIYNRWGEIVHEVDDNTPWDGKNCQIGVYSYSVRTHNQHFVGNVHLIK